jgi:hypothetical protein
MGAGKVESFLQRIPRWAWWAVAAASLAALVLRTRNFFVPIFLALALIGLRVLPGRRARHAPAIALFITLALMLGWRLLS